MPMAVSAMSKFAGTLLNVAAGAEMHEFSRFGNVEGFSARVPVRGDCGIASRLMRQIST